MKRGEPSIVSDLSCWVLATVFAIGFAVLAIRLKEVQIDEAADYSYASSRQSERRVQTAGIRGRIVDCRGVPLAENRTTQSIVCDAAFFQKRTWEDTVVEISNAVVRVSAVIGKDSPLTVKAIRRHVRQALAMPLVVWRDIDAITLARFSEHEMNFPGFSCQEQRERVYPLKNLAAHILGYVGRDRAESIAGDEKFSFCQPEMRGRSGLELYYDGFLRGVPGELRLLVDARGFAISEKTITPPRTGPDLTLAIDARIQRAAEQELAGLRGACAVMDPRNGGVLALASSPGFDPNDFVPTLSVELYARYSQDPEEPLLNRASGGSYAPGSTFKPIVALAGLSVGYPDREMYECTGVFAFGQMQLHCASRWGHGSLDMREALMKSCNPYFCNLALDIGTNAIVSAAREFGLGMKTGLDLGVDAPGLVPDAEIKKLRYGEKWYAADLIQMSIGQGMMLATPLQMARVAGAIGTGRLVTPHLRKDMPTESLPLQFPESHLKVVREGMRMVVAGEGASRGTGRHGGEGIRVSVSGKTGTAEVGMGERRRKNVWFIAYAPSENPTVAIALIIENGESGGATAAPKVANILRGIFGSKEEG